MTRRGFVTLLILAFILLFVLFWVYYVVIVAPEVGVIFERIAPTLTAIME